MTDIEELKNSIPTSPAFVIDESAVLSALEALVLLQEKCACKILYSIKSLPLTAIMALAKPYVDGFSVSSLFEARLAAEILTQQGGIHLTTPGIRPDESDELASLCSHISCNSIGQFRRLETIDTKTASLGLRINPQLSFAEDARYDPCRQYSKLGADIKSMLDSDVMAKVKGLHFHTVFGAADYTPLIKTLSKIEESIGDRFAALDWLNFGGGYLYNQIADNAYFCEWVNRLRRDYGLDIYIEPGNGIVGKAGYLIATVIDRFNSDGKTIAILDTSVNHLPQVFEYQRQPEVVEHNPNGIYSALLAGSTCLAGDLFGEYRFNKQIEVGDRLVFSQVGAYSLVKANRFNGYNLPDVYAVNNERIRRIKHYTYQDYRQQWGSDN